MPHHVSYQRLMSNFREQPALPNAVGRAVGEGNEREEEASFFLSEVVEQFDGE